MIIHKCDICGKDIGTWLNITIEPNAASLFTNVSNLVKYSGEYEICEKCFMNLYETMKGENNAEA